jgi:trigger factor|tara:strand:+ start:6900 stop:8231 length:1332 start_codon:yes stop_codon:yes gene_type:complete
MNITDEKIDDLNAVIKIKLTPEDYMGKYEAKLKEARKQSTEAGFRPGKVPMGMIKKKFGQSILADELNGMINETLYKHIQEKGLNVLGNPLPSEEHTTFERWEAGSDFEFGYKIGLAPEFTVKLSSKDKVIFHKIKVDSEIIDKQIEDFAKRYGQMKAADVAEKDDMVFGEFVQKEGDITAKSTVSIPLIDDAKIQKKFIGLKAGDKIVIDPKTVSKGDADMAAMLHIKKEELNTATGDFEFTVEEIKRLEKAPVDQELFDKIHGKDTVKTEKEFRAKIEEEMSVAFVNDSERLFQKDLAAYFVKKLAIKLPDEFLKSWIQQSNEKNASMEEIEAEYPQYSDQLKWQLIENKIIQENEIKVEIEEVKDYVKGMLVQQYAQYNMPTPDDAALEENALGVLKNQEETKKIFDYLYKNKVSDFFKNSIKLQDKEVSQEDFIKLFYA